MKTWQRAESAWIAAKRYPRAHRGRPWQCQNARAHAMPANIEFSSWNAARLRAALAAAGPHGQAPRFRLTSKTDARSRLESPSLEALLAGADVLFANLPA